MIPIIHEHLNRPIIHIIMCIVDIMYLGISYIVPAHTYYMWAMKSSG